MNSSYVHYVFLYFSFKMKINLIMVIRDITFQVQLKVGAWAFCQDYFLAKKYKKYIELLLYNVKQMKTKYLPSILLCLINYQR